MRSGRRQNVGRRSVERELAVQEGEDVGGFVGLATRRLALPVAGLGLDAHEDRVLVAAAGRGLQARRELAGVAGVDAAVLLAGLDQRGGIARAVDDVVVRRVR